MACARRSAAPTWTRGCSPSTRSSTPSKDVAGQLEKIFADDLRYSRRIDDARDGTRGFLNRLLELISLLFRVQM
jgi:hypothetical protein